MQLFGLVQTGCLAMNLAKAAIGHKVCCNADSAAREQSLLPEDVRS